MSEDSPRLAATGPPPPAGSAIPAALMAPFARMAGLLVTEQSFTSTLDLVVSLAAEAVPGVDGASLSMARGNGFETPAWTNDTVLEADHDQYELHEGPCVAAVETGDITFVESVESEARWPTFGARAAERGITSVLSLPLGAGEGERGALNLYSSRNPFSADERVLGAQFAGQAAVVIGNARAYMTSVDRAEQLNEALQTRDIIGQAKGIIMATRHCSPDEAFDILRRASQRENRKLRDVAQSLVDRARQTSG